MNIIRANVIKDPEKYHFCFQCGGDNAKEPVLKLRLNSLPVNKDEYDIHICLSCARGMNNNLVVLAMTKYENQLNSEVKND